MKKDSPVASNNRRLIWIGLVLCCFVFAMAFVSRSTSATGDKHYGSAGFSPLDDPNFPTEYDIRSPHGTPRGTDVPVTGLPSPTRVQLRAVESLKNVLGILGTDKLRIEYNGLTGTPRHIINRDGYLSPPSSLPPEKIAMDFIARNREIFRFSENDLSSLKLMSRATSPEGTTTLLYNQQLNGKAVYHGDVLVNVARNGQIVNAGGESYPGLVLANAVSITSSQAIQYAATRLNVNGFTPTSLGSTQVLTTFGELTPEFVTGEKFSGGSQFGDDIVVTQVVFPMGGTARLAYKFVLTTPQYGGVMWQHFIDAQTGVTLRRSSLTAFQSFGPSGGGVGVARKATLRPDVQNMVEAFNNAGTAQGKVFDSLPTLLSGRFGSGRATRSGVSPSYTYMSPTYALETQTVRNSGRGFKTSLVDKRNESARFPDNPPTAFTHAQLPGLLSQISRGFPDASNPTSSSPFGWFYLPTDTGGAEITAGDSNRTTTRSNGYSMSAEAVTRNQAESGNSPVGGGLQPFSSDVTALPATANLADGRVLSSVIQSRYTEGNNVMTADDRANDNETTHGIKGYSVSRQFVASYFDYVAGYEFGGLDAASGTAIPATADPDIFPGTVSLFYFNNIIHDYLYGIGFTEPFWNFQMDNFGKGGAGGDRISAQVQDGSGTNNANFGAGDDGAAPRMQMFVFTEASFRRSDGDFDFDVVAHEHFHGVSNRSAGKGLSGCLGVALVGESGGMGEGWSDYIADSMSDDDAAGEFVTGEVDVAIRRLPVTNYRWSYGSFSGNGLTVRRTDPATPVVPDVDPGGIPFEVHDVGEVWSAILWDMRELLIVRQDVSASFPGIFFDGTRRMGSGTNFYIGNRQVQSVDAQHPINYRPGFGTSTGVTPTINAAQHIVRPGMIATENISFPGRNGPLATAVSVGARLSDRLVLRGLQLAPCNPSFVEMRDSILAADKEITGGENLAIIWRAFASHGVGDLARSTGGTGGTDPAGGAQSAPTIVEDFSVPATVSTCESSGPLAAPAFTLSNLVNNKVTVTITADPNATSYIIARSTSANGPFATIATQAGTSYTDDDGGNGLILGQTYYYQVHAARNPECVGSANTNSITITTGVAAVFAPVFFGVGTVSDPRQSTVLNLTWAPATSANPIANIVYDIYRVTNITSVSGMTDSTTAPTFTPTVLNRITPVGGITATSYNDTGLTLGQVYYYIVQARDTAPGNGKLDTFNTGNRVAKFSAPTSSAVASTPFSIEDFEAASANTRFTPPLLDSANPDVGTPQWQRAMNSSLLTTTTAMYAPDFDPTPPGDGTGAPSDFNNFIGPITVTQSTILEFDSRHSTEFAFDGGVVEVVLGAPGPATTFPDNSTTFDLNYFLTENGYSAKLDGTLAGPVFLSPLQGRFGFTGTRSVKHIRAALGSFRSGGAQNPGGLPVFLRFRSVSDVGTSPGVASGWYIDNLVVNNYSVVVGGGMEADVSPRPNGDNAVQSDDVIQMRRFLNGTDTPATSPNEFQRADSAPIGTNGDGMILSGDVVQTRRYQNGSDPPQSAAGPTTPSGGRAESTDWTGSISEESADKSRGRVLMVESTKASPGRQVTVNLKVGTAGDESEYGFIVDYDPEILSNPVIGAGNAGAAARVCNIATPGRINCSVGAFSNSSLTGNSSGVGELLAGTDRTLITVTFNVATMARPGLTEVTLSNVNVANDGAQQLSIGSTNGNVVIVRKGPVSVNAVSRIRKSAGRGLVKMGFELIDASGRIHVTGSNPSSWFNVSDVCVGKSRMVVDKRQRIFQVTLISSRAPTELLS